MARLKQLEPKKETIGGLNFYIRPFPAMIAANLTGVSFVAYSCPCGAYATCWKWW